MTEHRKKDLILIKGFFLRPSCPYHERCLPGGKLMKSTFTSKPRRFIMFHKPKGTIVTLSDEKSRKTVYDILPRFVLEDRWIPVGRLDRDSRGLLLFTREGGLSDLLTQPGKFSKFYEVWIRGRITEEQLQQTLQGVKTPTDVLKFKGLKL